MSLFIISIDFIRTPTYHNNMLNINIYFLNNVSLKVISVNLNMFIVINDIYIAVNDSFVLETNEETAYFLSYSCSCFSPTRQS